MVLYSVALGSMVVLADDSGTCGDNLTWAFNNTSGELTISGTGTMTSYPDTSGYPWHSYRSSITKLTIGDNVTCISRYTFCDCENLKK